MIIFMYIMSAGLASRIVNTTLRFGMGALHRLKAVPLFLYASLPLWSCRPLLSYQLII